MSRVGGFVREDRAACTGYREGCPGGPVQEGRPGAPSGSAVGKRLGALPVFGFAGVQQAVGGEPRGGVVRGGAGAPCSGAFGKGRLGGRVLRFRSVRQRVALGKASLERVSTVSVVSSSCRDLPGRVDAAERRPGHLRRVTRWIGVPG
ncbi:hypothetical protein Slala03_74900 [Streptomyces lavendulae subsp. lavendulae]|nr:hypothetical protein Slala03_74900 [Streptomyces lavendulae subsp. lavendulae]